MKTDRRGFTLFEMVIAGALAAIVMAAVVTYFPHIATFFRRMQVQQQAASQSTTAMDTMERLLRNGKATSVQICSCNNDYCSGGTNPCAPSTAVPPSSQITFSTLDGHFRRFYWRSDNSLMMDDIPLPIPNPYVAVNSTILASNVTNVMFSGDYRDLSQVNINLRMDTPLDSTNVLTVLMPTHSVRMVTTQ